MAKQTFIYVKQIKSTINKPKDQKATVKGLGLGKINKVVKLIDTPAARGMAAKVAHLVEMVDASQFVEKEAK
ncbi:MAG: 50S ribosomal protein L30 [Proteobacteria bacterium]|nr:50S ribosomal protein L30 [Pseudomonadota bacterium]